MIDFRYLLTTIVAIFFALAIGLLIGSGLLAAPLSEDLGRQVQEKIDRNNELLARINELQTRLNADDEFALQLVPGLVDGELTGDPVVVFRFEGTDGRLTDRLREAIQAADGSVPTTITITDQMAMDDESAAEALRGELEPRTLAEEEDLAIAVARALGSAAAEDSFGTSGELVFDDVVAALVDQGFLEVETERESAIPLGASFVVAAGADSEPAYDLESVGQALVSALASGPAEVVAVEGWQSEWNFVAGLRDSDLRDVVATVDHGDTVAGSVSAVLELDREPGNEPGHYGFRGGSDAVAPGSLEGG